MPQATERIPLLFFYNLPTVSYKIERVYLASHRQLALPFAFDLSMSHHRLLCNPMKVQHCSFPARGRGSFRLARVPGRRRVGDQHEEWGSHFKLQESNIVRVFTILQFTYIIRFPP